MAAIEPMLGRLIKKRPEHEIRRKNTGEQNRERQLVLRIDHPAFDVGPPLGRVGSRSADSHANWFAKQIDVALQRMLGRRDAM